MNPAPPIDVTQAVRAEFAVPGRYQLGQAAPPHRTLLGLAFQWLYDRWSDLWNALASHLKIGPGGAAILGDLLVAACVAAIAIVGAHLLLRLQYEGMRNQQVTSLAPPRSAHALAALATQAANAGDFARAVRLLFMAAVTLLDLRGIMRDERSATVNQLRRRLRERDGALEPAFVEIARLYTAAAYAQTPADPQAWQRARAAYDDLVARATS